MAKKVVPFKIYKTPHTEITVPVQISDVPYKEKVVTIETHTVPQEETVLDIEEIEVPDTPLAYYDAQIKLCMESDKLDEATKNELASNLRKLKDIQGAIDAARIEVHIAVADYLPMLKAFKEKLEASIKKVNSAWTKWFAVADKFNADLKILLAKFEASSKKK